MLLQYISLLLAWRYIKSVSEDTTIATMLKICFFGITVGSFSLALIISIAQGFEQSTYRALQGMHADVTIDAQGQPLNIDTLSSIIYKEFPEIEALSSSDMQQVMIKNIHTDKFIPIFLKGIYPHQERLTSALETVLISENNSPKQILPTLLAKDSIIIGHKLAQALNLAHGDSVSLLFAADYQPTSQKIILDNKEALIGATFKTGIDDFDTGMAFCSFNFLKKLFPEAEITSLALKVKTKHDLEGVASALKKRFYSLQVYSWKELYPALINALLIERYAMLAILGLIILTALLTMVSLIFMIITYKKRDIAILQTMGAPFWLLVEVFSLIGVGISALGSACGLIGALIIALLIKKYPFITLPDVYYVAHLPIEIEINYFLTIFALFSLGGLLISVLCVYLTCHSKLNYLLRAE